MCIRDRDGIIVETQGVSVTAGIVTTPSLHVGTSGAVINATTSTSKVGIGTTNPNATLTVGAVGASGTSLFVHGDARVVGVLSVGQGTITLDPTAKTLTGIDELKIGSGTTAITIKKSATTGDIEFADEDGQESSIGIGTTVSINTSGIVTAAQFVSNSTTTAFYPPVLTTTQRDAMSGLSEGAMIFNSTDGKLQVYDGSSWTSLPGMTLGLSLALDS